ncbi:hypothetical protein ROE7235_03478 [Roseibaca ekhonensis]|uniref:Uncharacterized protein n=1 Tax=Roseinatronobacter ekhonensis TaxID=254356 RepID=A0A3B0MCU2_9RHOB|nr:hypothetical protein ROE7235_03478 [Roseibaca ekhonensis]
MIEIRCCAILHFPHVLLGFQLWHLCELLTKSLHEDESRRSLRDGAKSGVSDFAAICCESENLAGTAATDIMLGKKPKFGLANCWMIGPTYRRVDWDRYGDTIRVVAEECDLHVYEATVPVDHCQDESPSFRGPTVGGPSRRPARLGPSQARASDTIRKAWEVSLKTAFAGILSTL